MAKRVKPTVAEPAPATDNTPNPAYELPAILTNYLSVTVLDAGVRIAWGESPTGLDKDMRYRMSHIIPASVFPSVVELLSQVSEKMQVITRPMVDERKDH